MSKFEPMYTKSLKKTLGLPMQTPNTPLLTALGIPSLTQIAAHHIVMNSKSIEQRFSGCPKSLSAFADRLTTQAVEYAQLHSPSAVSKDRDDYYVDLLAHKSFLDKCYLGLVTGTFLTMRFKKGQGEATGKMRECPVCRVPASHGHFLNTCPVNSAPRAILSSSVPPKFSVKHLQDGDFSSFYKEVRMLKVIIATPVDKECPIPDDIYCNLAKAASEIDRIFTSNTLSLFEDTHTTA